MVAEQSEAYSRVSAKANLNLTHLFAHLQFGRIVPPVSFWRLLIASRWRRALLLVVLIVLYKIGITIYNGATPQLFGQ